jgi:hypothetical protein
LGGYHAINIPLRHSETFTGASALSRTYDLSGFLHGYWIRIVTIILDRALTTDYEGLGAMSLHARLSIAEITPAGVPVRISDAAQALF